MLPETSGIKTYVLLEHTHSTANVYQQVNQNQRVRLKNRPVDHAFNQITFMDRDGKNKTIRLKLNCDEIYQDKQIKDFLIPANEKWTQEERDALRFQDGILMTNNPTVQKFLEASPQFDGFWIRMSFDTKSGNWVKDEKNGRVGSCTTIKRPLYKLLDKTVELKSDSEMFRKRLAAANKIAAIKTVKDGQDLLLRLNGTFFKTPGTLLEIEGLLIQYLDEADEKMLDFLLKEELSVDEKTSVLIGKAVQFGIISFDAVKDQVVRIKGSQKTPLKEISSEYAIEDREKYFVEFLTGKDGKLMLEDIQKAVEKAENE